MELIISFIIAFLGCVIYISISGEKKKSATSTPKSSKVLYCSSNRNSYADARDVFKTLKDAGIRINFLGGNHE